MTIKNRKTSFLWMPLSLFFSLKIQSLSQRVVDDPKQQQMKQNTAIRNPRSNLFSFFGPINDFMRNLIGGCYRQVKDGGF